MRPSFAAFHWTLIECSARVARFVPRWLVYRGTRNELHVLGACPLCPQASVILLVVRYGGTFLDTGQAGVPSRVSPERSSSQAIELIRQPSGVRTNCVEITPRTSMGSRLVIPRFA
jgi:hypothetical protein